MARCYLELRKGSARGTDSVMADIMRHLHARQYLGKAVVVCDSPVPLLSAGRKQWLKLARTIQKQRASTLNADKILKYTHMIAHMQHTSFSAKTPIENPSADVYFLKSSQVAIMPIHCWTVYTLTEMDKTTAENMMRLLPSESLLVDYTRNPLWEELSLEPKEVLESQVAREWQRVVGFLKTNDINIAIIARDDITDVDSIDDALDTLLGMSHRFLQVASDFQHALELARPLRLTSELRKQYDAFILLAHRVQALSPGAFTQQFLEIYDEDDTFFLYDVARQRWLLGEESFSETYQKHVSAGRHRLAHALRYNIEQQKRPSHFGVS